MPRGSAISVQADIFKTIKEKEVKKEGEETPTLWTPGTGKRFLLQGFILTQSSTAASWAEFFDEGTLIFGLLLPKITEAATPFQIQFPVGYESAAQNNKLILKLAATQAKFSIVVYGTEVA